MLTVYPHQVDIGKSTYSGLRIGSHFVNLCRMERQEPAPFLAIGLRLKAIREAESDLSQKEWAERHGFGVTQYNNWEKGNRRITVDEAERLCELYGLSLDFLYRGRLSGVPDHIKNLL